MEILYIHTYFRNYTNTHAGERRGLEVDPAGRVDAGGLGDGGEEDLLGGKRGALVARRVVELRQAVARVFLFLF